MKRIFLIALPLAFAATVEAQPAALPKSGDYDYSVCFTRNRNRIDFSKEKFAVSYEETGKAEARVPGSLFDGEHVRCVGMVSTLDGKVRGESVCEGLAADGDRRLTRFWYDAEGKLQREQVSGTGKYDGMVTTGSVKSEGQTEVVSPGVVKFCHHATGTYTLK